MYWRHVVASTMPEREEFEPEEVNSGAYLDRHGGLMFGEGFSFSGFERDKLWIREGDRYLDASDVSGADDENDGRALVVADFDDDGDPDTFVYDTQRARQRLFRNDVGAENGRFVKVRLRATRGHPEAAGAVVRARFGDRELAKVLAFGSGFLSQNAPELVFGLGAAEHAELEVRWPGRAAESFGRVRSGATYLLTEGTGSPEPRPLRPATFADPPPQGLRVGVGDAIPTLAAVDAGGAPRLVAPPTDGRERLVTLWASWCAACIAELPDLEAIAARGQIDVVMLGLDAAEERAAADETLAAAAPSVTRVYLTDAVADVLLDPIRLPLPTTLRIDPDGVIREVIQGRLDAAAVDDR